MFAWILIGLISGWLAGKILNGDGYGMMADIALGLVGGVIGGMMFAVLGVHAHNFVGAILMSTAGATALVIATRIMRDEIWQARDRRWKIQNSTGCPSCSDIASARRGNSSWPSLSSSHRPRAPSQL